MQYFKMGSKARLSCYGPAYKYHFIDFFVFFLPFSFFLPTNIWYVIVWQKTADKGFILQNKTAVYKNNLAKFSEYLISVL